MLCANNHLDISEVVCDAKILSSPSDKPIDYADSMTDFTSKYLNIETEFKRPVKDV